VPAKGESEMVKKVAVFAVMTVFGLFFAQDAFAKAKTRT
jgi:hypothetical protein